MIRVDDSICYSYLKVNVLDQCYADNEAVIAGTVVGR